MDGNGGRDAAKKVDAFLKDERAGDSHQGDVLVKDEVFKHNGGYRAQVYWVDNLKMPDGSIRTDEKNPDASKRSTRADQIVLIDKVTFDGKDTWENGKIYDPTSGKVFTVSLYFKDEKTLTVKGSIGPFFQRMYWKKIQ